jgi:hypothetical protein
MSSEKRGEHGRTRNRNHEKSLSVLSVRGDMPNNISNNKICGQYEVFRLFGVPFLSYIVAGSSLSQTLSEWCGLP